MGLLGWWLNIAFGVSLMFVGVSIWPLKLAWIRALTPRGRAALVAFLVVLVATGTTLRARDDYQREKVWAQTRPVWNRLPLRVRVGYDLRDFAPQLEAALRTWNEAVGCQLFEGAGDRPGADVRVVFTRDTPCNAGVSVIEKDAAAGTFYCPDGTADIEVQRLGDVRIAYRVFAHELGHVLGLAHDEVGLMAPAIRDVTDQVAPSSKDRDGLRAWYCDGRRADAEAP